MLELRRYRGVMFNGTQDWYKVWRKTNSCFQKRHEEFGKVSPEHLKVSKLGLWWHPFVQSWKCMSLKFTGVSVVELTCQFQIDMRNLTIFDPSIRKSQKFTLGLLLTKVYNVWAKKSSEELCLMALKIDAKFKGKLTCFF